MSPWASSCRTWKLRHAACEACEGQTSPALQDATELARLVSSLMAAEMAEAPWLRVSESDPHPGSQGKLQGYLTGLGPETSTL